MSEDITETGNEPVALFPAWKQAGADFVAQFSYGDLVPLDWFYTHFELTQPEYCGREEFNKFQFAFLDAMENLKTLLLQQHSMALANVRGQGYRVLKPAEQTGYAMTKLRDEVRRTLRKAAGILEHVDRNLLSDDERRHNEEARGKLAALHVFNRKQLGQDR